MIYKIFRDNLKVEILDIGATILSMQFFNGAEWLETTLQYENIEDYSNNNKYYLNSVIGPHSGRIKDGKYRNETELIQLEVNDGTNHLHGGSKGFHTLKFVGKVSDSSDELILNSIDEKNKCNLCIRFRILDSKLLIDYTVEVLETQVMNMTHHTYFNLSGEDTIENHRLKVPADKVCFLDQSGAPERLVEVDEAFDFRSSVQLKEKMSMNHDQFGITDNIDHPFKVGEGVIRLESDKSNIGVAVSSDRPFAVVYTGNYFLQENDFKGLGSSKRHQAIAIEPQYLPNDINIQIDSNQLVRENMYYFQQISYEFYTI